MTAKQHNWGYANQQGIVGPAEWPKYYQVGTHQSPIDISICECLLVTLQGNRTPLHSYVNTCCASNNNPINTLTSSLQENVRLSSSEQSKQTHKEKLHHHEHNHHTDNSDEHRNNRRLSSSSVGSSEYFSTHQGHTSLAKCYPNQITRYCFTNKKIFIGYPRYISAIPLCNTGHSWQINLPLDLSAHTLISGPPFGNREYRLAQLHCHWSQDLAHGSEHTVNGRGYAAEIHFVHWNCSQYETMEEASRHKHGLAVLGVFVQASDGEQDRNKYLDKIIDGLNQVKSPNSKVTLRPRLDLKKLLPANRWLYASYEGSLTTPPLSEVVDWVVFLQPIQCSSSQIEQFSQIKCQAGQLDKNCRPVQPHNDRVVSLWSSNERK